MPQWHTRTQLGWHLVFSFVVICDFDSPCQPRWWIRRKEICGKCVAPGNAVACKFLDLFMGWGGGTYYLFLNSPTNQMVLAVVTLLSRVTSSLGFRLHDIKWYHRLIWFGKNTAVCCCVMRGGEACLFGLLSFISHPLHACILSQSSINYALTTLVGSIWCFICILNSSLSPHLTSERMMYFAAFICKILHDIK